MEDDGAIFLMYAPALLNNCWKYLINTKPPGKQNTSDLNEAEKEKLKEYLSIGLEALFWCCKTVRARKDMKTSAKAADNVIRVSIQKVMSSWSIGYCGYCDTCKKSCTIAWFVANETDGIKTEWWLCSTWISLNRVKILWRCSTADPIRVVAVQQHELDQLWNIIRILCQSSLHSWFTDLIL